ncbi:MAG: hypothetical protein ACYDEB_02700 [Dehalococcoidia bacterium]
MPTRPQRRTTRKKPNASPPLRVRKKPRVPGGAAPAAASIPEGYAIGPYGELIALEGLGLAARPDDVPAQHQKEG